MEGRREGGKGGREGRKEGRGKKGEKEMNRVDSKINF